MSEGLTFGVGKWLNYEVLNGSHPCEPFGKQGLTLNQNSQG